LKNDEMAPGREVKTNFFSAAYWHKAHQKGSLKNENRKETVHQKFQQKIKTGKIISSEMP
jgi:hypothetical protein